MNVVHIGVISFENLIAKRELKAVGGIQGFVLDLINYSLRKDIEIVLVGKIYNYRAIRNLKYYEVQNLIGGTNKFLFYLFLKSIFTRIPKNSIIHAHRPDHYAVFSLFRNSVSLISLHGQQSLTINTRKGYFVRTVYGILEKFAFSRAHALVAVDERTKEYYLQRYPNYKSKIHVIPTGVDTNIFKPLDKERVRKKFGFSKNDKIVLYVGRIEPPKKVDEIIRAFHILATKNNDCKLVIVGDGVLMDESKAIVKELELEDSICFFGIRKRNELPEIYSMADISVLYSGNEGSPLSVKESLACGIPVVANAVGDIPLIIKNGFNGYILENDSRIELSLSMKKAIENVSDSKKQCIESIMPYSIDNVSQEMIDLYKKITNEK